MDATKETVRGNSTRGSSSVTDARNTRNGWQGTRFAILTDLDEDVPEEVETDPMEVNDGTNNGMPTGNQSQLPARREKGKKPMSNTSL